MENTCADTIYKKTILGVLAKKCVILVTHQLEFIQNVKKIMVLQDGKQTMLGSFDDLMRQGFNFDDIVKEFRTVTHKTSS